MSRVGQGSCSDGYWAERYIESTVASGLLSTSSGSRDTPSTLISQEGRCWCLLTQAVVRSYFILK